MCLYIKTCLNVRKRDLLQLAQENGSYCKNTRGTYGRNDFTELLSSRSARNGHRRVILGLRAALKIATAQLENVHLFLLCFTVNIMVLKITFASFLSATDFDQCPWFWLLVKFLTPIYGIIYFHLHRYWKSSVILPISDTCEITSGDCLDFPAKCKSFQEADVNYSFIYWFTLS